METIIFFKCLKYYQDYHHYNKQKQTDMHVNLLTVILLSTKIHYQR